MWQVTCKHRELTFLVRKVIGEAAGNREGIVRKCRISSRTGKYVGAEESSWDGWLEIGKRRAEPIRQGRSLGSHRGRDQASGGLGR